MAGFAAVGGAVRDLRCTLGEGPLWSVTAQALYFVDIQSCRIHRLDPAGDRLTTMQLAEEVACLGLIEGGGFIAGLRSGLWRLDADGQPQQLLAANPEDTARSRFNDGGTDPAGRFIAGTLDQSRQGGAALYRYDARGLVPLTDGLITSNGVAFSPDGRRLYHSDTPRFTLWVWDYDPATGAASNRRVFARFGPEAGRPDDRGRPDGGAVDAEGCYWSALYEGGRVQRLSPEGALLAEYPLPARCPTMVAFGGPDLRTLYCTTARAGRPEAELAELPLSGALFALRAPVPGLPRPPFNPLI